MEWDIESVSKLMLEAAKLALTKRKTVKIQVKNTVLSTKNEIFTNVDTEVEALLSSAIEDTQKNIYVLGEEGAAEKIAHTDVEHMFAHSVWVVDPIDGTSNFANGLPAWGISLGLIENFEFKEGAIILPDTHEFLISSNNSVYQYQGQDSFLKLNKIELSDFQKMNDGETQHDYRIWAASTTKQLRSARTSNKSHIIRSCVYAISKVLTQNYFAFIGQAKIWDFAAGIALFKNKNMKVYYHKRKEKTLAPLPWKITKTFWHNNFVQSAYEMVFSSNYNSGLSVIPG